MIIDLQKVKNGELNLIAVNENINIIRDTIKNGIGMMKIYIVVK